MKELYCKSQECALSSEDQGIALKISKIISEAEKCDGNSLILGLDNCLHLAKECVFHDLNWDKQDYSGGVFAHRDKVFYFVHKDISQNMAFQLGAIPLSHIKLSARKFLPFDYQCGGQSEPLTTRLKAILSEYDSDLDVFKEMTQNADDAQASEVKFLIDYSDHGVNSLIHDEMKHWQGPAIYCYNNSSFTDADFINITRIAARSKMSDRTTIGAYGIGFNTVYHLTDVPSFVSRHLLNIFDPHVLYLEGLVPRDRPGMQLDFIEACEDLKGFKDQFSVYNGVFGCDLFSKREYNHTLFRLPLRKSEVTSKISQKRFDNHSSIRNLQNDFLKIAKNMILFLQNIECLELYERTGKGQDMKLVYKVTRTPNPIRFLSDNKSQFEKLLSGDRKEPVTEVGSFRITTFPPRDQESESDEILLSYSSGTGRCFGLIKEIQSKHEVSVLPVCSIAIPKRFLFLAEEEFYNIQCYLFCFLPIPCQSSYPMHINGCFQLQQSRRALHCSSDNSIRTRWNQALISDALSIALVNILVSISKIISHEYPGELTRNRLARYYSFWPNSNKKDLLWKEFSSSIATYIMSSNAPVFYCRYHPDLWISLEKVVFFTPQTRYTLDEKFVDFMFSLATNSDLFFFDCYPEFEDNQIIKFIRERNETRLYSLERVCKEIIFQNLTEVMERDLSDVKLFLTTLLSVLKYEPWLKDLLSSTPCIPCGETEPILRAVPDVVSPFSEFKHIFYDEDRLLPHSIFHSIFDKRESIETAQVLESIGIITTLLPVDVLVERCEKVYSLDYQQSCVHVNCLLDYLNRIKPGDICIDDIRNRLMDVRFLPVHQDEVYNAICPNKNVVFAPPSRCYGFNKRMYLTPEYHAITEEVNSLRHVVSLLGISQKEVPLEMVLDSIILFQQHEEQLNNFGESHIISFSERFEAIYVYVAGKCFLSPSDEQTITQLESLTVNKELVQTKLKEINWIWHHSFNKFYPIDQVILSTEYLHFRSRFLVSFPLPQLIERSHIRKIFEFMQIPNTVTPVSALRIISLMKEYFKDQSLPFRTVQMLSSDEGGLVIHLINSVIGEVEVVERFGETMDVPIQDPFYLLTEVYKLELACELYQNDVPWVSFSEEESASLVHHGITRLASHKMGAKSKMDTMYDLEWKDFGQHEKITNRIENLLREFPCDVTIFKELLQNAEDSGATEIAFVLDCQNQFGQETLCPSSRYRKKWKELQTTPSLLVYNNRSFSDEDLEGIQAVGIGGKQGVNTIGRFGLGFNSVYHLTRCPCLLTCSEDGSNYSFCVFDPFREHLNIPEGKLPGFQLRAHADKLDMFRDQFSPYYAEPVCNDNDRAMHNLRQRKEFSIFRLPLNAKERSPEENVRTARDLLDALIREAPRLFPFITNVKEIQIFEITHEGISICKSIIFSEELSRKNVKVSRPIAGYSKSIEVITKKVTVHAEGLESEVKWLIYHFEGNLGIFLGKSLLLQKYESTYEKEKLRLFSSVAVETVSKERPKPTQKTFLYCHLPFGTSLDFPVHINAPFILDPNRRYVSYQDQENREHSWDNVWHGEIMERVLTPLYFQLLIDLGPGKHRYSDLPDCAYFEWYYTLFPVLQQTGLDSNSMEFLQSLSREVLTRIYEDNSQVLLADDVGKSEPNWYPVHGPHAGIFKMADVPVHKLEDTRQLYSCLVDLQYHLTYAPLTLSKSFECCRGDKELGCKFVTARDVLNFIQQNNIRLSQNSERFPCSLEDCIFTFEQLNIILEFVLTHYDVDPKAHEHMPCISLKVDFDDNLGVFKRAQNSTNTIKYAKLLPNLFGHFLSEKYDDSVVKKLSDCHYVQELHPQFLSNNLIVASKPSREFFLLFWSFYVNEIHDSQKFIKSFSHFKMSPITYGNNKPDKPIFESIEFLQQTATDDISKDLKSVLRKMKCPFLYFSPFDVDIDNFPHGTIYSIKNAIKSLAITSTIPSSILKCLSSCKEVNSLLNDNEAELLRNLLPNVQLNLLDGKDIKTLTRLKIFIADQGHERYQLIELKKCDACFMNENFPVSEELMNKLKEQFKLVFLSCKLRHNNPAKLVEQICARTGKPYVKLEDLVDTYILHPEVLPRLQFEVKRDILKFLFNLEFKSAAWFPKLKSLPFIRISDVPPHVFTPTQLYSPNDDLFVAFKKDYLLPQCWAKTNELYEIFRNLGLIVQISLQFILECAQTVTREPLEYYLGKKIELIVFALMNYLKYDYQEKVEEDRILQQLARIKFLPMRQIRTFIKIQEDTGEDLRLGSFSESQLHEHFDYCCTSCPVLYPYVNFTKPSQPNDEEKFFNAMRLLGVHLTPHVNIVKQHLQNLIELCHQYDNKQIDRYLRKLFYATYEYLQNISDEIPEFKNVPCILYQCKLYKPQNVVLKMKYTIFPYLFQCLPELASYKQFLIKLKVGDKPTYKHFNFALHCIREVNGGDQLDQNNIQLCKQADRAFECLIRELRDLDSQGEVDIDLSDSMTLVLTKKREFIQFDYPNLFYADDTQLLSRLNRIPEVPANLRILAPLMSNDIGSCAPPRCLKINPLSSRFRQTLCPEVYVEYKVENDLDMAQRFQSRVRSTEVYQALRRIYFHENSQDLNRVRIRGKQVYCVTENDNLVEDGCLSVQNKLDRLEIVPVSRIDIKISDNGDLNLISEDACICFLDESNNTILFKTDVFCRERLPVEMTYELNQYLANLFEKSLINLEICLVYPGVEIMSALDNFNIRQLPPGY